MVQLLWKTVCQFFKKLNMALPYDPAIPLLGDYSEELYTHFQRNNIHNSQKAEKCVNIH